MEKFEISKDDLNVLLYFYYSILYGLKHYKGLKYKQVFNSYKLLSNLKLKVKKINIDDYIEVV